MERVLAASTLPALLLGGEVPEDPDGRLRGLGAGAAAADGGAAWSSAGRCSTRRTVTSPVRSTRAVSLL